MGEIRKPGRPSPVASVPMAQIVEDEKVPVSKETNEDYLRQYQYKKVGDVPMVGGVETDPQKGSKAEAMKNFLLEQRKIAMLIPLAEGSDPKILASVTLNGYRLDFPTNTYIDVPEQVANVVRDSNKQTLIAINRGKIGEDNKALV